MKNLKIKFKNNEKKCEIIVKKGFLERVRAFLPEGKNFIITNETVFKLYGKYFDGFEVLMMNDGEQFKTFDTYKSLIVRLLEKKIHRDDTIIALGGGVVGDVAGFVAATCLRGVNLIQIPTTLLAQTDSAIGGKTGFDTDFGKNLIGAFYQPSKILIDTNVLKTLDERQFKTGLAEVIKYAFIEKNCGFNSVFSQNFFDYLKNADLNDKNALYEVVLRCVKMKMNVVSKDEREGDLRCVLNFGHTFAHAIEKTTSYNVFTHGEAVAIGMKMALKLAFSLKMITKKYFEEAISLLKKFNFELELGENIDKNAIFEALIFDKKVKNGKINFILPVKKGFVKKIANIDEEFIKKALN